MPKYDGLLPALAEAIEYNSSNGHPLLDSYAQQGLVFLTPKQVMAALGKTWGQVSYAIRNYMMDCFIICGEYRITIQAVRDYIDNLQSSFEEAYHEAMNRRELTGVHALAFDGQIRPALDSLRSQGYPDSAIDDLLDKSVQQHYAQMPAGTTQVDDFYDIPSLPLYDEMYVFELADLFQVDADSLARDMHADGPRSIIEYPSIYDYLVIEEFLNANVPVKVAPSQKIVSEVGQLELF